MASGLGELGGGRADRQLHWGLDATPGKAHACLGSLRQGDPGQESVFGGGPLAPCVARAFATRVGCSAVPVTTILSFPFQGTL